MDCEHCVTNVKSAVGRIRGVKGVEVSLEKGLATLRFDVLASPDEEEIRKSITRASFLVGDVYKRRGKCRLSNVTALRR